MRLSKDKGASMVEFALILPLLLFLLFGIIEFSLLLYDKAVLTNASREGARFGILYQDVRVNGQAIKDRVINYCQAYLVTFKDDEILDSSDINLKMCKSPQTNDCTSDANFAIYNAANFDTGDILDVQVTYPYHFLIFPNLTGLLGESTFSSFLDLQARTRMQGE